MNDPHFPHMVKHLAGMIYQLQVAIFAQQKTRRIAPPGSSIPNTAGFCPGDA